MGGACSCFEDGGSCDCTAPPPRVDLDGAEQHIVAQPGKQNLMMVKIGSTHSQQLRQWLREGKLCAIEMRVRVLSGRLGSISVNVDENQLAGRRKLVQIPIQPEPPQPTSAWGNSFAPGFSPQQASNNQAAQAQSDPWGDLGNGGAKFRLFAQHTNGFEGQSEYYLSLTPAQPGTNVVVDVKSLVEMMPGQGLQPAQHVPHAGTISNKIRDINIPLPTVTFGNKQQQQYPGQPQQQMPNSPFGQQQRLGYNSQQPGYNTQHNQFEYQNNMDAQLHIRNLEQEIQDQQQEIASLKKQNRALDEKLYQYERTGGRNMNASASELQLNRYKEYILKAKEVIQQQKERIVDLETTTMVGRLEAHLLEYKEYASRQKLKLSELSQDFELVDKELREVRSEGEELRARYHILKRQSKEYRDEASPRRTPHYSARRLTRASGGLGATGSLEGLGSPAPYTHAGAVSEWERELLAPKTPVAPGRDRYHHDGGLLSREAEDRILEARREEERGRGLGLLTREEELRAAEQRRDDARREELRLSELRREEELRKEKEREWDRDYYRKHGYAAAVGLNPYASKSGNRHRNATSRSVRPGSSYYNRYGRFEQERDRAAMKIQSAWRGYLYRRRHPSKHRHHSHHHSHHSTHHSHHGSHHSASSLNRASSKYGGSAASTTVGNMSTSTVHGAKHALSKHYPSNHAQASANKKLRERTPSPPHHSHHGSHHSHHPSSGSKHTSHSKHHSRSRYLSDHEAALRIQHGWRRHLERRDAKRRSSSKHHYGSNRPGSASRTTYSTAASSSSSSLYGKKPTLAPASTLNRSGSKDRLGTSDFLSGSFANKSNEGYSSYGSKPTFTSSNEGFSVSKGYSSGGFKR